MFSVNTTIDNKTVEIGFNQKLSIRAYREAMYIKIDGEVQDMTNHHLSLMHDAQPRPIAQVELKPFSINDQLHLTEYDGFRVQMMMRKWERHTLQNSSFSFRLPTSRDDDSAGIPKYLPAYHALLAQVARSRNRGYQILGQFFNAREMEFIHQYITHNPRLHQFIISHEPTTGKQRLHLDTVEFMINQACHHIEAAAYAEQNGIHALQLTPPPDWDDEYGEWEGELAPLLFREKHVLDSPQYLRESIDVHTLNDLFIYDF